MLKSGKYLGLLVLILSLSFSVGCTDIIDKIPLSFLKSEKKKDEPEKHKLSDPNVVKEETNPKKLSPPSDKMKNDESTPVVPKDDKTIPPKVEEKDKVSGPVKKEKTPLDEKGKPTKPPAEDSKPKKVIEKDEVKKPKKLTEETTEAPIKKDDKLPVKDEKVEEKERDTSTGGIAGEDIALLPISPGSKIPSDKVTKPDKFLINEEYKYDPTKKRDPFRPYNVKIQKDTKKPKGELTPLQKFKLSQLTVKAIIYDPEKDTGVAMIEDPTKRGYNIYVGTEIANGEVIAITPNEIRVRVEYTDFFNNPKTTIETLKIKGGK